MNFPYIPTDLLRAILDYDGRIKYRNGEYVDIIQKNDIRYSIIAPIISKKMDIMENIELPMNDSFYFEFGLGFDMYNRVGLCYDYNFSYPNQFEICYYDWRCGILQIRTYL
jgi:hypothetical protein